VFLHRQAAKPGRETVASIPVKDLVPAVVAGERRLVVVDVEATLSSF